MEEEKPICSNCEYFINEVINHNVWTESIFKCKKCVLSVDPITGDTVYGTCNCKNFRGDCQDFLKKESDLIKFLKLFKKK